LFSDSSVPLDRPTYQMNEAARLLDLPDKTLRRWLDGDRRFDKVMEPLIRPEPTGSTDVTWGEFVEAGFLREFRYKQLPIERLRPLISALRERLQTPYPLAQARPLYSSGRDLLWREQETQSLDDALFLVVRGKPEDGYQLVLSDVAREFVSRVDFEPPEIGAVARWYPMGGEAKRIALDPRIAFGLPTINGIRTEALAELRAAGEPVKLIEGVYRDFGISAADIELALRFERQLRQAA